MQNQMESQDDIFLKAREIIDTVEQAGYLAKACGGDAQLRQRIEAMLRDAKHAEDFFGKDESEVTGPNLTEQVGAVIGRYKLLQRIGEGGMGVVYMAEQREPVIRKVALKIIKLGMDTKQVVARFEAERQALALMDHPNIAKVLDGGATDAGRPYFVMELVQGMPITQFCDESMLPMGKRLDLFLDVCSAVQHAHQKGIIHRDIKPSNILVTIHGDEPVPKVIDFGIAKATHGRLTDKTLFTQFQQFVGTPAYMSPEQTSLSGLDMDTRSDIYALGVLLYELLTGQTPFDTRDLLKAGLEEMRQIIREQEPPKPSTRLGTLQGGNLTTIAKHRDTEPPKLIHLIRGDLDWIVMKCLEKDRARRYETANGLAMDLQRHLNDEPVAARPPSTAYRIQKTLRRHKLAFSAGGAVAFVLLAGITVSTWEAVRATRAEREAKRQAAIAQSVKSFVTDQLLMPMDEAMNHSYDPQQAAAVARAAKVLQGQFTNEPLVEAEIRLSLGTALDWVNDYSNAISHLKVARQIFTLHYGRANSNTLGAATHLGNAYYSLDRRYEAISVLTETIAAGRPAPESAVPLADALRLRGRLLADWGRLEATNDLVEALAIYRQKLPENDFKITEALHSIAWTVAVQMNRAQGEKLCAEGVARCMKLYGPDNGWTSAFLKLHGRVLIEQERYAEAAPDFALSWTNLVITAGADTATTLESEDYLAQAYAGLGRTNEAAQIFDDVSRRWLKIVPYRIARTRCYAIASWHARNAMPEKGINLMKELKAFVSRNPVNSEFEFGALTLTESAIKGWPTAAEFCRAQFENFTDSPNAWRWKAVVFSYVGDDEWYSKAAGRALALIPVATNWIGKIDIIQAAARGRSDFTQEQLKRCEYLIDTIKQELPTVTRSRKQQGLRGIATLELKLGRPADALKHLNESLECVPREVDIASTHFLKALCLHALGNATDARAAFDAGQAEAKKWLPEPVSAYEGFLTEPERYCILLRRQAKALTQKKESQVKK